MDLYYILIILYFLLFLALSIKNLKWAIYLLIFVLPSYQLRFTVFSLPTTVLEGMILILFLVWLFKGGVKQNFKLQITNYKYLYSFIGIFLLAATISIFVGPELKIAAGIWKAYFIEPILFLIVLVSVLKKEDFKNIFKIFLWQILILGLVGLYQQITGDWISNPFWAAEATRRITSLFAYPNALALYLAPVVALFIGLGAKRIKDREKGLLNRWHCLLIVGLGLLAIYFSGSKGAMLAILAALIFYILFYQGYRKYVLIFLILILIFGYILTGGKIDLKGTATVEDGDSVTTRLEMWGETWQMLKERPVLGAGLAGYQVAVEPFHRKDYIEIYLYPHNFILNFWSEIGLLGLLGFLLIVGWFYWIGFRYKLSVVLMASMTALLVHGLVDVPYFKNDLSILFWLLIGMMVILKKEKAREIGRNEV